jgi:hypothetical protein
MRQRVVGALTVIAALGLALVLFARSVDEPVNEPPEEPKSESIYDRPTCLFEVEGRNPGSAADPWAPGRVRPDAPAQHELGRKAWYDNERRMRGFAAILDPVEPLPHIEPDPRFSEPIRLSDDARSDDFPAIASNPANPSEVWMVWTSYSGRRDRLHLAWRDPETGVWGAPNPVPGVTGDVWRPSLAFDGEGRLWVLWAQQELFDTNFDIYARPFKDGHWGRLEQLTSAPEGDFSQSVARGPDGSLHVVWQGFRNGRSDVFYLSFDGQDWSQAVEISTSDANDWAPSVAVAADGTAWVAWDSYASGSYDVLLRPVVDGVPGPVREVAASARFEAQPSVTVDGRGRVWVAYEVGEYGWGKDQGLLIVRDPQPGALLNGDRQVQVRVFDGDEVLSPEPELATLFPNRERQHGLPERPLLANPLLGVDGEGRVHIVVRTLATRGGWAEQCRPWVVTTAGDGWSEPALIPYSESGRVSMFSSTAPAPDGDLWVAWARDNLPSYSLFVNLPEETVIENTYCARFAPGDLAEGAKLGPPVETQFKERPVGHPNEVEDVARMRSARVRVGGRSYQVLRGDTHRHTEMSMDLRAMPDGSVLDFYRYMLDAAAMDWGMISDHNFGSDREYWWWIEEKLADMFHAPEGYLPVFGYERSVSWPNGHRNIIHAKRGVMPVPFIQPPGEPIRLHVGTSWVIPDDTKLLYQAIRRSGGIAISHTPATNMGTDWRDNDPELEPVVELAQGDRRNYEHMGAPLSDPEEAEAGHSRYSEGFVANAWNKGYRLGVILSSDHLSTHLSYAMVWAEDRSREAIMEALRARRTYGATDNILLEFWIGDHFMGEEFAAGEVPPLKIKVVGTDTISDVQVIRNNRSIYTHPGGSRKLELDFVDTAPETGTNFYYLRVLQENRQAAWSSPIWVDLE